MLMCSRCKKRPAVVFISQMNAKDPQHKKNEGLCLVCAKELGISQVDDYMKAMGISDDDLEAMSDRKSTRLNSSHPLSSRMPSSA